MYLNSPTDLKVNVTYYLEISKYREKHSIIIAYNIIAVISLVLIGGNKVSHKW